MRLAIHHQTNYRYDVSAEYAAQILRLTPRSYDGLHVVMWNVSTSGPGRLSGFEDGFGNISQLHTLVGMHDRITVAVDGIVETSDCQGLVRGAFESLPAGAWLRTSELTRPSEAIAAIAAEAASADSTFAVLSRLMDLVAEKVTYIPYTTNVATTAAQAIAGGSGVCQDQAHVFIAAARLLGIPARYVGGYLCMEGQDPAYPLISAGEQAGHAWAEAFDSECGWTGFDPANKTVPGPWHVRTSIGLDYESAAPVRGIRRGAGIESLQVDVKVSRVGERIGEQ